MLVMVRDKRTEKAVLGRLLLGGVFICYTLENAAKAIPAGLYSIENSVSPKFKRELPLLHNAAVPAKRGIRIHSGNSWKDSSGCVLVGMSRNCVAGTISESKNAETMITMLCRNICQLAIVDNT